MNVIDIWVQVMKMCFIDTLSWLVFRYPFQAILDALNATAAGNMTGLAATTFTGTITFGPMLFDISHALVFVLALFWGFRKTHEREVLTYPAQEVYTY